MNTKQVIFIISRLVYNLQQPYISRYYLCSWYSSLLCSQHSFNIWLCIIKPITYIDINSLLVTCSTKLLHGWLLVYFPLSSRLSYKYGPRGSTNLFCNHALFYPLTKISSVLLYHNICVNCYPAYMSTCACERVTSLTWYLEELLVLLSYFVTVLSDWANWCDA